MLMQDDHTHMLHVWYIYLQNWVIFRANVGKYSIHGAYGTYDWLVLDLPLWKIWLRQLGWFAIPKKNMENEKCSKPPTSHIYIYLFIDDTMHFFNHIGSWQCFLRRIILIWDRIIPIFWETFDMSIIYLLQDERISMHTSMSGILPSGNLTQLLKITFFNGKTHYINDHFQ